MQDISTTLHAVALMPALRSLRLDVYHTKDRVIVPAVNRPSQLGDLRPPSLQCTVSAAAVAALAQACGALTALTELQFCNNWFGAAGADALCPALRRLSRLASLELGANNIGAAAVSYTHLTLPTTPYV